MPYSKKPDQPCFTCEHCIGGCPWSRARIPIPGWDAEPHYERPGKLYSYQIKSCPQYVREKKRRKDPKYLDDAGVMRLLERMMAQMRDDYRYGEPKDRRKIEQFLRSQSGQQLLQLSDTETVIRGLRKMVRIS